LAPAAANRSKPSAPAAAAATHAATAPAATASAAAAPASPPAPAAPPEPEYEEVTIPSGTSLLIELRTTVGSETSHVEDPVHGTLRRSVTVHGLSALPSGSAVAGHVTQAERSGRVKGLAVVAFRFTAIDPTGDAGRSNIATASVVREAESTKKKDAAKIGGGAVGGAVLGGILGGGDGAAKGAAIGGAAGTGVVLGTRGKEVTVPAGTEVEVKLTAPLTVRVRR
jgi:hypothetical protein